jgi:hypothetical protein
LSLCNIGAPLNNDNLSAKATNLGSRGRWFFASLALFVCKCFLEKIVYKFTNLIELILVCNGLFFYDEITNITNSLHAIALSLTKKN